MQKIIKKGDKFYSVPVEEAREISSEAAQTALREELALLQGRLKGINDRIKEIQDILKP